MNIEDKFDVTLVNENLEDSLRKAEEMVNDFINTGVKV